MSKNNIVHKYDRSWRRMIEKYKTDKKCEICGCSKKEYLEFDRCGNGVGKVSGGNLYGQKLLEEMKKCRLLCIWCRRLHSSTKIKRKVKSDYIWKECFNNIPLNEQKKCKGKLCMNNLVPIKYFYKYKTKNGNYKIQTICKKCKSYEKMLIRRRNKNHIINIKIGIGKCKNCDRKVTKDKVCCFDFDHIDRNTKFKSISELGKGSYTIEKIDDEIKKCQLLCCYCHYDKTLSELNYYTTQFYTDDSLKNYEGRTKKINRCKKCNIEIYPKAKMCKPCYNKSIRKVINRPSKEILFNDIQELGYSGTGRKYGVSGNAIKKWLK